MINPIKNEIVRFITAKKGLTIIYTKRLKNDDKKSLFDIQSRLRRRSFLHGCIVAQYHPEMDFTHSLSLGGYFINDFRSNNHH